MDFNEKLNATGHLEIIKIDKDSGKETVLFDDHNVITSGLGQSIAQFMTVSGCVIDTCITEAERFGARPSKVPDGTENANNESAFGDEGSEGFSTGDDSTTTRIDLGGDGSSLSSIVCYCNQYMTIIVQKSWENTAEVTSESWHLEVLYGIGCEDSPAESKDDVSQESYGDKSSGGFTLTWDRSKNYGECPKKAPVTDSGEDVDEDDPSFTNHCVFEWGSFEGNINIMENCFNTDTGGEPQPCEDPAWADGLTGDVEYGQDCPNGPHTVGGPSHCYTRPRAWQNNIRRNLTHLVDSNDMGWEDSNGAKEKCEESQS